MNKRRSTLSIAATLCALGATLGAASTAEASALWKSNYGDLEQSATWSSTLSSINSSGVDIDDMAAGPSGQWIIVANGGQSIYYSTSVPALLVTKIQQYVANGATVDSIVFAPNGSWALVAGGYRYYSSGFPNAAAVETKVSQYIASHGGVRDIAVSSSGNGWIVVGKDNAFYSSNMGSAIYSAASDAQRAGRQIREIEVASDGSWVLSTDNWYASGGLASHPRQGLQAFQANEWGLEQMMLSPGGSFAVYKSGALITGSDTIDQLEYSMPGGNIFEQMQAYDVPGVSVALIENGVITGVRSYGEAAGGEQQYAYADTRFLVASLSKPVVKSAMKAIAGITVLGVPLLDLNDDILDIRAAHPGGQLDTWMDAVEANPSAYGVASGYETFPSGVTTNSILSMNAGFPYTSAPTFIIPSTDCATNVAPEQWLRGYECQNSVPNSWPAIWPNGSASGTYSSPSYTVALAIAEDVYPGSAGFADVFRAVLFDPAGMDRTTFDIDEINADTNISRIHSSTGQPAPDTAIRTAIAGGGLYSTAEDQARYLQYLDTGVLGVMQGVTGATGATNSGQYQNYSRWKMDWNNGNGIVVLTNGAGSALADALITRFFEL